MHHHTNRLPASFCGAGALMDPVFLRQATDPHAAAAEPAPLLTWAAGVVRRVTALATQGLRRGR